MARQFPKYITDPQFTEGAQKQFHTHVELDIEEFLQSFEDHPTTQPPKFGAHPAKLRDAIAAV